MVGDELEGDDGEDALEAVGGLGDADGLELGLDGVVSVVADDDGLAFPGRDLLQGRLDLGVQRVLGHHQHHGHVLVNQRKGAVLQLTRQDTLRVHVGHLFDLEGAFQACGVLVATPHDQQALLVEESILDELLKSLVGVEHLLDLLGEDLELVDDLVAAVGHADAILAELDGHHQQGEELGGVGLGGGHSDLGPSVDVDTALGFAGNGGSDGVGDAEAKSPALQAVAHGQDGVGSFAGLRNKHANIVTEDGGLAIQEIRRELSTDGDLGELFEDGPGGNARVVAGAAGNKHHAAATTQSRQMGLESTQSHLVGVEVDTATHGVDDTLGLLVNFLLHEVVKVALHDGGQLDLKRLDGAGGRGMFVATQAVDVKLTIFNMSDIVVFEVENALGVFHDGRGVGGEKVLHWLGETVLRQESTRLAAAELVVSVDGEQWVALGFGG